MTIGTVRCIVAVSLGATLAGCPDDPDRNPRKLWLALDGRETEVKLVDFEPPPY